jgi:hypothetical protein
LSVSSTLIIFGIVKLLYFISTSGVVDSSFMLMGSSHARLVRLKMWFLVHSSLIYGGWKLVHSQEVLTSFHTFFSQSFEEGWGYLSQPHFGQVWGWSPTLPKLGIWSPPELLNVQSSTKRPKTPRIEVFLMSLERSWSVDIENGLALAIWTSVTEVMGKRRARSQFGNLTPDH